MQGFGRKIAVALRRAALPFWVLLNTFAATATVFSGYAGYVNQEQMPFAGIVGMTFPAWYVMCLVMFIADLCLCKRAAVAPLAALIVAIKPWLTFFPMNFGPHEVKPEEADRSFSVISYNIVRFLDEEGKSTLDHNRTLSTIINSGADIVMLAEFHDKNGLMTDYLPQSQLDSMKAIYPYLAKGYEDIALFAKAPIECVTPASIRGIWHQQPIEIFRTTACGRPITIFALHLQSIGLNDDDKELYREIIVNPEDDANYRRVRTQLVSKLMNAFSNRARQAKLLCEYVDSIGGNAIVCGDFNDVPGCRAMVMLEKIGMKDAYAETAFGPCITFNAPMFVFRIDHVLYRGDLRAVKIERGNVASSDHYPMLTTFVWDP